jgi:hypothetical protein
MLGRVFGGGGLAVREVGAGNADARGNGADSMVPILAGKSFGKNHLTLRHAK